MATKKASSHPQHFTDFHYALSYAQGDESQRILERLSRYLRKIGSFQDIVSRTISIVEKTDCYGRFWVDKSEWFAVKNRLTDEVAQAFYAGVVYGERFGDNLSGPFPPVASEFFDQREGHARNATERWNEDREAIAQWRLDAKGEEGFQDPDSVESDALRRLREYQRTSAYRKAQEEKEPA